MLSDDRGPLSFQRGLEDGVHRHSMHDESAHLGGASPGLNEHTFLLGHPIWVVCVR